MSQEVDLAPKMILCTVQLLDRAEMTSAIACVCHVVDRLAPARTSTAQLLERDEAIPTSTAQLAGLLVDTPARTVQLVDLDPMAHA
jgi:hypothetical protein